MHTLMSGCVKINSPREGSRVNPLTPAPVLSTNCKTNKPCQRDFGRTNWSKKTEHIDQVDGEKVNMLIYRLSACSTETFGE